MLMMMTKILCFFFFLLAMLLSTTARAPPASTTSNKQVVLGMDATRGLAPERKLYWINKLFDIHRFDNHTDVFQEVDMLTYGKLKKLTKLYRHAKYDLPQYITDTIPREKIFNNKIAWKNWMKEIGLGHVIPKSYDRHENHSTFDYPLILKSNEHFGKGVYVIHNPHDLAKIGSTLLNQNIDFMLEESLTGGGLNEISNWGAAYNGELLALRCVKRTFNAADVSFTSYRNSTVPKPNSSNFSSIPFVKGMFVRDAEFEIPIPCGRDVVSATRKIMRDSNHTGVFNTEIKLDNDRKWKMLEMNLRLAGTMSRNDAVCLISFVPWAYRMALENPATHLHDVVMNGPYRYAFRNIAKHEARVLETGGGVYQGHWVESNKMSLNVHLDVMIDFFEQEFKRNS